MIVARPQPGGTYSSICVPAVRATIAATGDSAAIRRTSPVFGSLPADDAPSTQSPDRHTVRTAPAVRTGDGSIGSRTTTSHFLSSPAGSPGAGSLGVIQSGALEQSNVDLTAELVNMITAQRVYQANAQTIRTQDQIMQTIVNLR